MNDLGPIFPKHASGGWLLRDNGSGWKLILERRGFKASVYATTSTTVTWTASSIDGRLRHEKSAGKDAEAAKAEAREWIEQARAGLSRSK